MSSAISFERFTRQFSTTDNGFTEEGGFYETFINNTGADSIKGTIVVASTSVENAVSIAPASSQMPIGIIYENEIPNGCFVKVVTYGKAEVLLKDNTSSTSGFWSGVSDTPGRMFQIASPNTTEHFSEIGHSLQSKPGGTNVLSLVQIHFN